MHKTFGNVNDLLFLTGYLKVCILHLATSIWVSLAIDKTHCPPIALNNTDM